MSVRAPFEEPVRVRSPRTVVGRSTCSQQRRLCCCNRRTRYPAASNGVPAEVAAPTNFLWATRGAGKMVCPMRIFVGLASVLLLMGASAWLLMGEEPAFLRSEKNKRRSWLRFIATWFTGELLYEWWRGAQDEPTTTAAANAACAADSPPPAAPVSRSPRRPPAAAAAVAAAATACKDDPDPAPPEESPRHVAAVR